MSPGFSWAAGQTRLNLTPLPSQHLPDDRTGDLLRSRRRAQEPWVQRIAKSDGLVEIYEPHNYSVKNAGLFTPHAYPHGVFFGGGGGKGVRGGR